LYFFYYEDFNVLNKKFINGLSIVSLLAIPFTAQADVLVNGGYDWNLDFSDPNNTTSYVYADGKRSGSNDPDFATNGIYNNSNARNPWGGQAYDAEQMFMEINNDTLYLAIVTGLSPENGYASGDILFDLDGDMTGVDGALVSDDNFTLGNDRLGTHSNQRIITADSSDPNAGYEYGLVVKDHDVTGNIKPNKIFDYGYSANAGDLFRLNEWNSGTDILRSLHPVNGRVADGTQPMDNFAMTYGVRTGTENWNRKKYVVETSISLTGNQFGRDLLDSAMNNGTINVHWNPLCNNDWIQFTGSLAYTPPGGNNTIPEPAPLALMLIGLVGLASRRKYR